MFKIIMFLLGWVVLFTYPTYLTYRDWRDKRVHYYFVSFIHTSGPGNYYMEFKGRTFNTRTVKAIIQRQENVQDVKVLFYKEISKSQYDVERGNETPKVDMPTSGLNTVPTDPNALAPVAVVPLDPTEFPPAVQKLNVVADRDPNDPTFK